MCIIVQGPSKQVKKFIEAYGDNCYENNPDGIGIMYHNDGKSEITVARSLEYNKDSILTFIPDNDKWTAIHFRKTSRGGTVIENVHPFPIGDGCYMMHNGTVKSYGSYTDGISDTRELSEIISHFPKNWFTNSGLSTMFNEVVAPSRVLIMSPSKRNKYHAYFFGTWTKAPEEYPEVLLSNDVGWKKKEVTTTSVTPYYGNDQYATRARCTKCGCILFKNEEAIGKCNRCAGSFHDSKIPPVHVCKDCGIELVYVAEINRKQCFSCYDKARPSQAWSI